LIFAFAVGVAGLADLVGLEKENLAEAFVGVDFGGQWSGVGDLQSDKAFPLRLKRRDVHDDAAAGISALAHADGQHVARDLEILHRTGQGKRIRRNDAALGTEADKRFLVKFLGINHRRIDVGQNIDIVVVEKFVNIIKMYGI